MRRSNRPVHHAKLCFCSAPAQCVIGLVEFDYRVGLRAVLLHETVKAEYQPGLNLVDEPDGIARDLPPDSEQQSILTSIADQTARLDTLTTEAQRAIDLLQQRRTALISAAVTGQIDVRGAVSTL